MRISGESVGNTAAIREALVAMVEAETEGSMDRDDLCGRCFEKMWNRCKHDGSCWVDKVINAIAAPARNCDIYTTSEEADRALTEYCSKMAETGECVKSCPYREAKGGCAFGWILAASGTKG